jgi:CHAD domain-containing protein
MRSEMPELVLGAAQARLTAHFASRRAAAQRAVVEALDSPRCAAMLAELRRLLDDPPLTAAAAEPAAAPVFGGRARRFARRMHAVQSVLGHHHDAVAAGAAARDIGVRAHLAGENAFSFGLLQERAHRDALEYEDQARRVWKRVRRARPRTWAR